MQTPVLSPDEKYSLIDFQQLGFIVKNNVNPLR